MMVATIACGGDDEPTTDGGSSGDGGAGADPCGFNSTRFLPFDVGNTWSYRVTDTNSGDITTKSQSIEETRTDATFGDVIVQLTQKNNGSTRSLFKLDANELIRLQQEDLDIGGTVERVTVYDPGQTRLSETDANLADGATWTENYTAAVTETGMTTVTTSRTEAWTVLGVDVACESGIGSLKCLHVKRERTAGGIATKEFWYAQGVGKVRETGSNQQEVLQSCSKP